MLIERGVWRTIKILDLTPYGFKLTGPRRRSKASQLTFLSPGSSLFPRPFAGYAEREREGAGLLNLSALVFEHIGREMICAHGEGISRHGGEATARSGACDFEAHAQRLASDGGDRFYLDAIAVM